MPFLQMRILRLRRRTDWTIITQLVDIYLVLKLVSSDLKFWGTFYYIILFV